jgi:hypothetical protein
MVSYMKDRANSGKCIAKNSEIYIDFFQSCWASESEAQTEQKRNTQNVCVCVCVCVRARACVRVCAETI